MSVKGRIVVIDDEVNAAAALETLLQEDGYEVARAHDASTGLRLLEQVEPDIVLTDLHYWEGPRGVKDLCAVCRTFNLGVAMHSGAEFGIELQTTHPDEVADEGAEKPVSCPVPFSSNRKQRSKSPSQAMPMSALCSMTASAVAAEITRCDGGAVSTAIRDTGRLIPCAPRTA